MSTEPLGTHWLADQLDLVFRKRNPLIKGNHQLKKQGNRQQYSPVQFLKATVRGRNKKYFERLRKLKKQV